MTKNRPRRTQIEKDMSVVMSEDDAGMYDAAWDLRHKAVEREQKTANQADGDHPEDLDILTTIIRNTTQICERTARRYYTIPVEDGYLGKNLREYKQRQDRDNP